MADINFGSTMDDSCDLNDYSDDAPDFKQFESFFANATSDDNMPSDVRQEAPTASDNLLTHPESLNDQAQQRSSTRSPQVTQQVVQEATAPDPSPAVAPPPDPSPAMAPPPAAQTQQQMPVPLIQQADQGVATADPGPVVGPPLVPRRQQQLPAPIPANQYLGFGFPASADGTTSYQPTSQQEQHQAGPQLNIQQQPSASAHMVDFHLNYPPPPPSCREHTLMYQELVDRCSKDRTLAPRAVIVTLMTESQVHRHPHPPPPNPYPQNFGPNGQGMGTGMGVNPYAGGLNQHEHQHQHEHQYQHQHQHQNQHQQQHQRQHQRQHQHQHQHHTYPSPSLFAQTGTPRPYPLNFSNNNFSNNNNDNSNHYHRHHHQPNPGYPIIAPPSHQHANRPHPASRPSASKPPTSKAPTSKASTSKPTGVTKSKQHPSKKDRLSKTKTAVAAAAVAAAAAASTTIPTSNEWNNIPLPPSLHHNEWNNTSLSPSQHNNITIYGRDALRGRSAAAVARMMEPHNQPSTRGAQGAQGAAAGEEMQGVIVEGSGATTAEEMQGVVEESGSTTAAAGEMQGVAVVDFATFSNVNMPSASVQEQQTMATQEQTTMATQQQQQGYENGNGQRVQEMEGSQQMQEMEGSQQMQEMEGSQQVQEMEEGDAIETDAAAAETAMQVEGQESGVSFEVGEEDEDMMDALLNSQEF